MPFLREGDDLQIDQAAEPVAGAQDAFHRDQPGGEIDIDVGAHAAHALRDREIERPARALFDVGDREMLLHVAGAAEPLLVADCAEVSTGQHLVEMEMRVDETRRDQAAARLDHMGRRAGDLLGDPVDPAVPHGDVDQLQADREAVLA